MSVPEFRDRLKKLHPIAKGVVFTILASVIFFIEIWLLRNIKGMTQEALQAYRYYDLELLRGVLDLVIVAPVQEEATYRGPSWLLAMFAAYLGRKRPDRIWERRLLYFVAIVILIALNWAWAFNHVRYPYTIFGFGLVWGGCVIATRKLHYAMILHAGSNAFATIGITLIHYFSTK